MQSSVPPGDEGANPEQKEGSVTDVNDSETESQEAPKKNSVQIPESEHERPVKQRRTAELSVSFKEPLTQLATQPIESQESAKVLDKTRSAIGVWLDQLPPIVVDFKSWLHGR
eukprot:TRINITY_DN54726_c0_g1_i3.p1 TRINITY_DN54726_c0_g1~~TRINITY_DN54726_c0_g1_i3.p1  ORF type:complete len:113 (-),score=19.39 TRINITY_DN54726_c0_g1_i3:174-512(-)